MAGPLARVGNKEYGREHGSLLLSRRNLQRCQREGVMLLFGQLFLDALVLLVCLGIAFENDLA